MGSKYDLDIKRLAVMLLPSVLRLPLHVGFALAIITPLSYIYKLFTGFRNDTIYRLTHDGQVCYLRAVANDLFDPDQRRITITDAATSSGGVILYKRALDRAVLLPMRASGTAVILNRRGFGGVNGYDFYVNIPLALYETIDLNQLTAVINTYKLASKRFTIRYI